MILFACNSNNYVHIYGEDKNEKFIIPGKLHSYSDHYVAIEKDGEYDVFDENKNKIAHFPDKTNITGVIV